MEYNNNMRLIKTIGVLALFSIIVSIVIFAFADNENNEKLKDNNSFFKLKNKTITKEEQDLNNTEQETKKEKEIPDNSELLKSLQENLINITMQNFTNTEITEEPGPETKTSSRGGSSSSSSNTVDTASETEQYAEIYNLTLDTVIFYYSDDAHSLNMFPIVEELENNYSFYKTNETWDKNAQEYLEMIGTTPTFICVKNNERLVGEVPKQQLINFCNNCQ